MPNKPEIESPSAQGLRDRIYAAIVDDGIDNRLVASSLLNRIADIAFAVISEQPAAQSRTGVDRERITEFGEWLKRLRADYSNAGRYREDDVALYILAEFRERFPDANLSTADPSGDFGEKGEK